MLQFIVMLAGLACLLQAVRLMARRRALLKDPVRTRAQVLRLELAPGEDGPDWYTPTVQFRDCQQNIYEEKLTLTQDTRTYAVGRKVPILYQRGNPRNVIDPHLDRGETIVYLVLFVIGLVLFSFGAFGEFIPSNPGAR